MQDFIKKFRLKELEIINWGTWTLSLRPQQVTLGSLVLSLNRPCPHLGEMTIEETADLAMAFRQLESLLNQAFQIDKINYLALMMVDHQVHFHIIPRYEQRRIFNANTYEDKDWPKPPNLLESIAIEEEELQALKLHLQSFL